MSTRHKGHHGEQPQDRRKLQRYLCNDGFVNCHVRLLLNQDASECVDQADRYGSPVAVTLTNFNHRGLGFFHHQPVDISRFADTDQGCQAPHALFDFDYRRLPAGPDAALELVEIRGLPAQFVYVTDSDVGTNYGLKFVPESTNASVSDQSVESSLRSASLLTIENELAQSSSLERYNLD